jgi:hypothetical protein
MSVSFILDALRKLEEKQVTETTRELLGKEGAPARRHRGRRLWPRTAAVVLLGGGCLLVALFLLRGESGRVDGELLSREDPGVGSPVSVPAAVEPDRAASEPLPPAAQAEEGVPAPGAGGENAGMMDEGMRPLPPTGSSDEGAAAATLPIEAEAPQPAEKRDAEAREGSSSPGFADTPAGEVFEAGIADAPQPAPDGRVVPFEELPDEIRGGLQDLRITGHIYSDDRSFRRLNVNDSMRKEGDTLPEGVIIEEVTESGAVFSYRGYRFFMGVY